VKPPATKRTGVLSLRTLGRGFWLGISASLALHVLLLATGRFQMPRWEDEVVLEARIEPVEFKAVRLPKPEVVAEAAPTPPPPSPSPAQAPSSAMAPSVTTVPAPAPVSSEIAPPLQPQPPVPQPPPASNPPPAATTQAAQSLKSLPRQIEIVFELNGMLSGRQTHRWQREGSRYKLETEGEVTGLAGLFVRGKLTQASQGRIGDTGLMPERYDMQRISGKKETLRFDYEAGIIEANNGKKTVELPLLTGAQDPLSSIYQLAMAAQDDGEGLIVAAGTKRIKGYPYRVLGMESLDTALGNLKALHVTRSGDSGTGGVHLWLSPVHHYLPVRVSYIDDEGTEWVLVATRVTTN
jgi:hypothetical protein